MEQKPDAATDVTPDVKIDLRGTPCPMNWVEAKLQLEKMEPGQLLEMILDDGDPIRNVPRTIKADGHKVVRAKSLEDGFVLVVERGPNRPPRR